MVYPSCYLFQNVLFVLSALVAVAMGGVAFPRVNVGYQKGVVARPVVGFQKVAAAVPVVGAAKVCILDFDYF